MELGLLKMDIGNMMKLLKLIWEKMEKIGERKDGKWEGNGEETVCTFIY